jgi:hypothetical protein
MMVTGGFTTFTKSFLKHFKRAMGQQIPVSTPKMHPRITTASWEFRAALNYE